MIILKVMKNFVSGLFQLLVYLGSLAGAQLLLGKVTVAMDWFTEGDRQTTTSSNVCAFDNKSLN